MQHTPFLQYTKIKKANNPDIMEPIYHAIPEYNIKEEQKLLFDGVQGDKVVNRIWIEREVMKGGIYLLNFDGTYSYRSVR